MKSHSTWPWCGVVLLAGCSCLDLWNVRSQSPDGSEEGRIHARLVGDLAVPLNMHPVQVEAVGLVAGLQGTGSDPAPSPQRAILLDEMQTRNVDKPNQVLASPNTAMVLVRGVLRPGIQKGDRFDVEVRIPSRSETTSLRGGHLLETRLTELAVLNNQIHEGHLLALAKGPVLVDPSATDDQDRVLMGRGRILGGGVALKSRSLGLVLKPGQQNVFNSSRIATAINKRFHTFQQGVKVGVATAKTDQFVELIVHPRYKDNITRYIRVVRAVALRESDSERVDRIGELRDRLLDPVISAGAALELEAIGCDGEDILLQGIRANDPEVRFYAAEALAYLDRREAAAPLGEAARNEPAFRVYALSALSAMDEYAACEQLRSLLEVQSAETRYGAFRALWAMNPGDPAIAGEVLGGQFSYHRLDTAGPPMIHATRNRRPEIVLFGTGQRFLTPLALEAGPRIMVTSVGDDRIAVSKYTVNAADQRRIVSTRVDDVIRAIVELGGTYPDVVQVLQEAKADDALAGRFEVDALPSADRAYHRVAGNPSDRSSSGRIEHPTADSPKKPPPATGLFARMMGRTPD